MRLLLCLLLFSFSAFGVNPYKTKFSGQTPICDNTYLELTNMPPIRDQGPFGLCYAHTAASLLDHLRCSKHPSPSTCYQDKASVLHLSRFNNPEEAIRIGGHTGSVLSRFSFDRKLSKESCADFEGWKKLGNLHREEIRLLNVPVDERHEVDFFYYISKQLDTATYDAKMCWAQEIVDAGVNTNIQDIMKVLDSSRGITWQELRYKILVPQSCIDQSIEYPEFVQASYPESNEPKNFKGFRDHVFRSLSAGYPAEASFCASTGADGKCNYHSALIVGQRHVCGLDGCELQFRIKNSYGKRWQDTYDNGWVSAENLSNLMREPSLGLLTILPKGQTLNKSLIAPYYQVSPINGNSREIDLSSQGKDSVRGDDKCLSVESSHREFVVDETPATPVKIQRPTIVTPPADETPSDVTPGNVTYVCRAPGKATYYGDSPQEGMSCRVL